MPNWLKTKRKVFYLTHLGQILARQLRELMSAEGPEWSGGIIGVAQAEHRVPAAPDTMIIS